MILAFRCVVLNNKHDDGGSRRQCDLPLTGKGRQ